MMTQRIMVAFLFAMISSGCSAAQSVQVQSQVNNEGRVDVSIEPHANQPRFEFSMRSISIQEALEFAASLDQQTQAATLSLHEQLLKGRIDARHEINAHARYLSSRKLPSGAIECTVFKNQYSEQEKKQLRQALLESKMRLYMRMKRIGMMLSALVLLYNFTPEAVGLFNATINGCFRLTYESFGEGGLQIIIALYQLASSILLSPSTINAALLGASYYIIETVKIYFSLNKLEQQIDNYDAKKGSWQQDVDATCVILPEQIVPLLKAAALQQA